MGGDVSRLAAAEKTGSQTEDNNSGRENWANILKTDNAAVSPLVFDR
jgi:hypothetical protein